MILVIFEGEVGYVLIVLCIGKFGCEFCLKVFIKIYDKDDCNV